MEGERNVKMCKYANVQMRAAAQTRAYWTLFSIIFPLSISRRYSVDIPWMSRASEGATTGLVPG